MLKIRLKRTGRKGQPHYRIVVAESTKPRDGKVIEELGYYNPRTQPSTIEFDKEVMKKWLDNGAQPSETMEHILVKQGLLEKAPKGSKLAKPKGKKKEASNAK
jgi:small subunit ribosomal protein S16